MAPSTAPPAPVAPAAAVPSAGSGATAPSAAAPGTTAPGATPAPGTAADEPAADDAEARAVTRPLPAGSGAAGLDEATLLVRAREGDAPAFEELARRHQAVLYRLAVRVLGNPADAEDALQEALLDAWRRIGRFRGEAGFGTWMYRVVTNRCLTLLRTRRPVPVEGIDAAVPPAPDDPARSAQVDAGLSALRRALAALPDDQRVCWVLRESEGLGYAEIAEITGASETAVRGRIHRARTGLAAAMRDWR